MRDLRETANKEEKMSLPRWMRWLKNLAYVGTVPANPYLDGLLRELVTGPDGTRAELQKSSRRLDDVEAHELEPLMQKDSFILDGMETNRTRDGPD